MPEPSRPLCEDLDCHRASESDVDGPVNLAHYAGAHGREDLAGSKTSAGGEIP
jgi:hypothetical protein